jgi:23S rRNA G2069 N7-methylase RlmK/C1962 C5-methylase RlmI
MFQAEDMAQWDAAEHRLRAALDNYVHALGTSYRGRLFAQDALAGLRLLDLTRARFDVVVMNPPFGALSVNVKAQLGRAYPRSKHDLLAIFVERGLELLHPGGRLGAITSRTGFFLSSYRRWREEIVLGIAEPEVMADLGHGVMDDAMVEAAAYVLRRRGS